MNNKTYFGLTTYEHGIKVDDITMIPFDNDWNEISIEIDGVKYIDLLDWKNYAKKYIHENHLIFPKGNYESEYVFTDNPNKKNLAIFIDSSTEIDETRHIKLSDEYLKDSEK